MKKRLRGQSIPIDVNTFRAFREIFKSSGGCKAMRTMLVDENYVDDSGLLRTDDDAAFNIFARVCDGTVKQANMEAENACLGEVYGQVFMVASNRPENDEHWEDEDWKEKASMSRHHRFLTIRDASWRWFNCLTFGLDGDSESLKEAIRMIEDLMNAGREFAMKMWDLELAYVGMFFHCWPHCTVNSLHLHIIDLTQTGPAFEYLTHKNLPIVAVHRALCAELADATPTAKVVHEETSSSSCVLA